MYRVSCYILLSISLLSLLSCKGEEMALYDIPEWARTAVWYQIFVERFENGDPSNDPTPLSIKGAWPDVDLSQWKVKEWTSDWYSNEMPEHPFYTTVQTRRYGGDLQGVINKLDYLVDLGITAIYFNPLNDAPSLHKYDARYFHHIDVNFGPDPEGDRELIATENPGDPSTWKWTSADLLFLEVVKEAKKRNIRVVMDYSWNHTGIEFWAWKDILEYQQDSPYADWYMIEQFDDPSTPENEFRYTGWANVEYLPELKKVDVVNRVHGKPYEGNIYQPVKDHIYAVTARWLAPDGNVSAGIDGYRLDVAEQIPMGFWRDYRKYVRSINPEAILIGEIWWVSWPDELMDPRPYVNEGDVFDIIMHYQQYKPARGFFAKSVEYNGAEGLQQSLDSVFSGIPEKTAQSMMHMSSSHDAPRLLTSFYNKVGYKNGVTPNDNPSYKTGKPDEETYQRVKLYLAHQFTFIGAPQIWAGDEMGMWGSDDPDDRKPLWWAEKVFEDESSNPVVATGEKFPVGFNASMHSFYKKMISLRKENPALATGDLEFLYAEGDQLVYRRSNENSVIDTYFNNSDHPVTLPVFSSGTSLWNGSAYQDELKLEPLSFEIIKVK